MLRSGHHKRAANWCWLWQFSPNMEVKVTLSGLQQSTISGHEHEAAARLICELAKFCLYEHNQIPRSVLQVSQIWRMHCYMKSWSWTLAQLPVVSIPSYMWSCSLMSPVAVVFASKWIKKCTHLTILYILYPTTYALLAMGHNLSTSCSVYDTLKLHTVQQQAGVGQKLATARGTASDRRATKVCCSDTRETSSECLKFSKPFSSFNGEHDGAYLSHYVLLSLCLQIMTFPNYDVPLAML